MKFMLSVLHELVVVRATCISLVKKQMMCFVETLLAFSKS